MQLVALQFMQEGTETSKPSLSSIHMLRDGGHKAQDPSAAEGALTAVCCQTFVPWWRTQLSKSIGPHTLQSSLDYFEWLWWLAETPKDSKRANITSVFTKEGAGNYRPIGFNSVPGNVKEEIFLETISKHMEDKKVIGIVCMDLWKENFLDQIHCFLLWCDKLCGWEVSSGCQPQLQQSLWHDLPLSS